MAKQKGSKAPDLLWVLYGAVALLTAACLVLLVAFLHKPGMVPSNKSVDVSLGSMRYTFANNRAVRRTDMSVKNLETFLYNEARHSGCPAASPGYEHVIAYTKDETQVFIKYGCGAADSPMYAVVTNGTWKSISPTNHFDAFEIPDCTYVTENSISTEIAPVCVNGIFTANPSYAAR